MINLLRRRDIRLVTVVEDGQLIGIVTGSGYLPSVCLSVVPLF
jgi:CBS domain-containing protein